jgi:rhodanese-related sulfurtransferase
MTALITRDELHAAIEAGTVVVLDTLPASYYEQAHLPGALNLVESDVADLATTLVPDRTTAVVTYCSNASCGNSQAVAHLLERAGYTNVRKYKDGIQDWVEAGLPVQGTSSVPA